MQETRVWSLFWEDPTCCRATNPVSHNYWGCVLEPRSHNYWAHVLQLLKSVCPWAHLHQETQPQWEAHAPQLERSPCNSEDPGQPKPKKNNKLLLNKRYLAKIHRYIIFKNVYAVQFGISTSIYSLLISLKIIPSKLENILINSILWTKYKRRKEGKFRLSEC